MEIRVHEESCGFRKKRNLAYLVTSLVSRWSGHLYVCNVDLRRVFNRRFWFEMPVGLYLALN